jgi:hypothetical protein
MSKEFKKQKKEITGMVNFFKSAPDKYMGANYYAEQESPVIRNRIRREVNTAFGEAQRKENMEKRGNPLSVIANEETPNPARRDKMMKLAKYNKDRGR